MALTCGNVMGVEVVMVAVSGAGTGHVWKFQVVFQVKVLFISWQMDGLRWASYSKLILHLVDLRISQTDSGASSFPCSSYSP